MPRLGTLVSVLVPAIMIAGCGGNAGVPSASTSGTSAVPFDRASGMAAAGQLFAFHHTPPHPPPRTHRITSAERARARAGGWTPVAKSAPWANGPGSEMLMTDGTVMVQDSCTPNWFRLIPDKTGSYINGTWKATAAMQSTYGPLYFASAVLPDGKLIVNGGEYNFCGQPVETNLGAIYDPVANSWTAVTGPTGWTQIGDAQSVVLPNGTYMMGDCCSSSQALLNEGSMTWTVIGTGKHDPNSEEGWTLLRNGDVLTADVIAAPNSEYYSPAANAWQSAGTIPVNLVTGEEIGPQSMRPNNTVWVAGATGLSATYSVRKKSWSQGPTFPVIDSKQIDVADGPSAVMPNGDVMIAGSPGLYKAPATFYVFNGRKLKSLVAPPDAPNDSSYDIRLLVLPNGETLEDDGSTDVEVYSGATSPYPGIAPAISSVPASLAHGTTYTISGKRFNGFSQTNFYGDDDQQATNYPLVRIVNNSTGHVFYCRTHNHSYMGIGSNKTVSTKFDVPSGIETGASTIYVVVNGIVSAGVGVTVS